MTVPGINSLNETLDGASFAQLEKFVEEKLSRNANSRENPMTSGHLYGPRAYASWISNYGKELARAGKGASFIMSEAALSLLNPTFRQGKIFNPHSVGGFPPGLGSFISNKLDVGGVNSFSGEKLYRQQDRLRQLYEGKFRKFDNKEDAFKSAIGPQITTIEGKTFEEVRKETNLVSPEGSGDGGSPFQDTIDFDYSLNTKQERVGGGVEISVPDFDAIFTKQKTGPALFAGKRGGSFFKPIPGKRASLSQEYLIKRGALAFDNVWFTATDKERGYVEIPPAHDETYVPFTFSDLRKPERRIYFRAFIDSIQENYDPKWEWEDYYGRTDQVGTYRSTDRIWDIAFHIVAMSPEGLLTMWKKISHITKMFYPTKTNGLLKAAPIVRVRIGDLMATSLDRGLPGVIQSPNFDYNQMPWETGRFEGAEERGKVPQMCKLSFKFKVIHDIDPYIDEDYNMDTGNLRRFGNLNEVSQRTEEQESDTQRTESIGAISQDNEDQ